MATKKAPKVNMTRAIIQTATKPQKVKKLIKKAKAAEKKEPVATVVKNIEAKRKKQEKGEDTTKHFNPESAIIEAMKEEVPIEEETVNNDIPPWEDLPSTEEKVTSIQETTPVEKTLSLKEVLAGLR